MNVQVLQDDTDFEHSAVPSAIKYFDYVPDFTVDASEASDAEVDSLRERWGELIPSK